MSSLPRASCLYVGHDTKTRKVFLALEGLTREQFECWEPPIAQLKGTLSSIEDIRSVIGSCAGQHL